MSFTTSLMKKSLLSLSIASITALSASAFAEDANQTQRYQEPTRGFFLEHGTVAASGQASVELHSGSDGLNSGGGIRLGLPNAELLLNSGLNDYDENSALLKWGLPRENTEGTKRTPVLWSLLAGVGHIDIDAENSANDVKQTNITLGIAATVKADAGTFTASPKLVYADNDVDDDTFFELDLGAYVGIVETEAGLFSAGIEALVTTADDTDTSIALGGRWLYNERINLDVVPFVFSDNDLIGVPGLVRLNIAF